MPLFCTYRISLYSFRGNYSFFNLKIQRPKVTVHKCAETIWGNTVGRHFSCIPFSRTCSVPFVCSFTHPYYIITSFFALFLVLCTLIYFHWEIRINVYERSLYKLDQTLMLLQETLDDPLWQMKLTEEEEEAHTTYSWNIKWQKCAGLNGFLF